MAYRRGDDLLGGGANRSSARDDFTAALKAPTYHLAWKRRRPPVARAQRRLWSRLKPISHGSGKSGHKTGPHSLVFQRDYPIMLGPDMGVIADIACVDLALIIEVTDDLALKRMNQAEIERQPQIDAALAEADWQVLSLWYRDVMERMDGCLIQLDRAIARAKASMD